MDDPTPAHERSLRYVILCLFVITVNAVFALHPVTDASQLPYYYSSLDQKSGQTLFDRIHSICLIGYEVIDYSDLEDAYPHTDYYPAGHARAGQLWDMYGECNSFKKGACGNYSNECDCWNKEHSIPKSWFGGVKTGAGCDIFHVVPTDGKVNGMRGNLDFGEVGSSVSYTYNGNQRGQTVSTIYTEQKTLVSQAGGQVGVSGITVFEPLDEYKGDFARGYFGTLLHWYASYNFTKNNHIFSCNKSATASNNYGLTSYGIALLLKWHRQDPVSQKEIDRNNGIQAKQGNRNPFIDYPYLAEYIWGERAGETLDFSRLVCSADEAFVPGVSSGYKEIPTATEPIGSEPTVVVQKVLVNGVLLIRVKDVCYDIFGRPVNVQ